MSLYSDFESVGLGLGRDALHLSPHHSRWKRAAADEAYRIYDGVRLEPLRLYHVGSSAVPGLAAKPVLDLLGVVPSLDEWDARAYALAALGYENHGAHGIEGRRYSVLRDPSGKTSYVHLHVFAEGDPAVDRHLRFRDFLRADEAARVRYEQEKRRLVDELRVARADYASAKSGVVEAIEAQAMARAPGRRVLALLGSASGGGKTEAFLRERYRDAELEVVALHAAAPRAFDYARLGQSDEEFLALVQKMVAADLVVFATPVYWYSMAGALKDFFDLLTDLLFGSQKAIGDALAGTRVKLLATGAGPRAPLGFEAPFSLTAIYLGMDYLGMDYRST